MKKTLAAVAAALTLAACSSGGEGGGAPANATELKAACSLLSDDQVAKVLDVAPKSHEEQKGATAQIKSCKWATGETIGSLSISYGRKSDYPVADMNSKGWEKIPGLGTQAAYQSGLVIVSAGDYNLQVGAVPKMDKDDDTDGKNKARAKGIEAAEYALRGLGLAGPVPDAPKTDSTSESTTRARPSGAADPTETSTPDNEETSQPDEPSETPETPTTEN